MEISPKISNLNFFERQHSIIRFVLRKRRINISKVPFVIADGKIFTQELLSNSGSLSDRLG